MDEDSTPNGDVWRELVAVVEPLKRVSATGRGAVGWLLAIVGLPTAVVAALGLPESPALPAWGYRVSTGLAIGALVALAAAIVSVRRREGRNRKVAEKLVRFERERWKPAAALFWRVTAQTWFEGQREVRFELGVRNSAPFPYLLHEIRGTLLFDRGHQAEFGCKLDGGPLAIASRTEKYVPVGVLRAELRVNVPDTALIPPSAFLSFKAKVSLGPGQDHGEVEFPLPQLSFWPEPAEVVAVASGTERGT